MSLFNELKRRNVIRVATAYVVASWLIIQVVETTLPFYGVSEVAIRSIITLLAIGFIPTLIFAWVFEFTPDGLKREVDIVREQSITKFTGKKIDRIIILLLVLAIGYFAVDKFILEPARDTFELAAARQEGRSEALSEWQHDSSIAVLPFSDFSPEGDHGYFSNGLAEELLNLLARVPGLRVTSRTSSFSFADKDIDIPGIASALNVAFVLEGSIRRFESRIRVTVQLIDTEKDSHIWSETYDRQMSDIFSIQDEIAALVIEALQITLASEAPISTPTNPEAFVLYLQARHLWRQGSADSIESALKMLQQVLALDPEYAPAWEGLSTVFTYQVDTGVLSFENGYAKARDAASKALAIDPDYAAAHAHLGWDAMIFAGDYKVAAEHFLLARRLAPNSSNVLGNSATLAAVIGRPHEAIDLLAKAISFDPIDSVGYTNLGAFHMMAIQYDDAEKAIVKALELSPGDIWAQQAMIYLQILTGRPEGALTKYEQMADEGTDDLNLLSMIYHDLGRDDESDDALAKYKKARAGDSALNIAENYAWRGESDEAFAWLNRAFKEGQNIQFIRTSAFFHRLKKDSRWDEFLLMLGLADDQVSDIQL